MIVLIDSNNIAWIAHHSTGELSYEEKRVGVIYGFLRHLYFFSKELKTNQFVFMFDSKKYFRRIIYPNYKKKDKLTEKEYNDRKVCYEQIDQLREEILPKLGFKNVFTKFGYEADDLLAVSAKALKGDKVIVSSDEDLYQLLDDVVFIYKPKSKKKYDKKKFVAEYELDNCAKWVDVKAMAGCTSDNVEGIKGVGEKTAIKYINGLLKSGKALESIKQGTKLIERNRQLVSLPFKGPKQLRLDVSKDELTKKKFMSVFDSLRFNSFMKKQVFEQWTERFKLK